MRSAIGVVWSGIGVVAPVSTCVPASSVKSAAASGNSCVPAPHRPADVAAYRLRAAWR